MPEIIVLGPLTLKGSLVLYLLAAAAGYMVMRFQWKRCPYRDKPWPDIAMNAALILFLFWKFGLVLTEPSTLWNKPLLLLMTSGSTEEIAMGIAAAALYALWECRKHQVPIPAVTDVISFIILTMVSVISLLSWNYGTPTNLPWGITMEDPKFHYHPVNVYLLIVTVPLLFWLSFRKNNIGEGKITRDFLTMYGLGLFLVSYFEPKQRLYVDLTASQWLYIGMVAAGCCIPYFLKKGWFVQK